ncbi:uncharacterized protein LOC132642681 [Lycium barbarum]|uniref:uncharacterized protein LOC132642681 n=1 Tax=Lycium barbarum TaxID=112863 RepID=UPI00293ED915|nr:uncharacterized protein LOC132642681 [Lycium barbarum]
MLCSQPKFAVETKMACCRKRKVSQVTDFRHDLDVTVFEKDHKQIRPAMLKKRFANVIFKSEQQLLLGNHEFDELQIKKKKENQLREEKVKVKLLKTQRQREREGAARNNAIERWVDFDDNLKAKRKLSMLTKVQMLKRTRDYSFLLSDDADLPVPSRGSLSHKASDGRVALPPSSKQYSSTNTARKLLNDRQVHGKPISGSSQMQSKLLNQKSVSLCKQTQLALGPNGKRVLTPGVNSTVTALHKPNPSKLQPSIPRQSLVQKKEIVLQSGKSKVMPKQAEPSYRPKPIMQKQTVPFSKLPPKNATRSLEDRRPARKPMRHDDDGAEAISMIIRRMFGYNPNRYRDDDDDDTSDMEANFDDILREEKQSAKIAKEEDEEELRKIEEEERRERLRKQAKKRKLSH